MELFNNTISHILVHLGLFAGFALLAPVITDAYDARAAPWSNSASVFFGGIMLTIISAFLLYQVKDNIADWLQSLGATIFLPGLLNVISGIGKAGPLLAGSKIGGMTVVKPIAEFYIEHSVPSVLSVAAVYLAVGGLLYWTGHKIERWYYAY